ncbi:hypothetical protein IMZ48_15495 [Candidatus Bathyarchaeota archaeon]|nr:hypothetical protein [Candidatus Bathyarchaeota archaeon]
MTSKLSIVETGIASSSTSVLTAVNTARQDTGAEISLFSESMDSRMAALERLVMSQHEQTRHHVAQQLSRVPGAPPLPPPAILREACDIVSPVSTGISREPRGQGVVCSRCGCGLREKTRSVAAAGDIIRGGALAFEHHETSRHFPSCPFYKMSSKSERRVGTRLRVGVWGQISVWVQASFTCTTGAGAFSISPNLSFRMVVEGSPASNEIMKMVARVYYLQRKQQPETEIVKRLATAERRILRMFHEGKASPHDRDTGGQNLQHVCFPAPWTLPHLG